jgi:hypothetical protein
VGHPERQHFSFIIPRAFKNVQESLSHASLIQRKQLTGFQGTDTPTSARIRENQRRSRNRRKELIEDLQKRIQEYEQKGVAATQEVQQAARRVAEENAGLRDLLYRVGASQVEIEDHLRLFRAQGSSKAPMKYAVLPASPTNLERASACGHEFVPGQTQCPTRPVSQVHVRNHPAHQQRPLITATPSFDQHSNIHEMLQPPESTPRDLRLISPHRANHRPLSRSAPEESECPNTTECFCAPSNTTPHQPPGAGSEISCEAAATIIVEMRGYGDIDSARASLGCHGPEECSVKNSTVLQIMDEG